MNIKKASLEDSATLTEMGRLSFIESHGHSAAEEDINDYVSRVYTENAFTNELSDTNNIYHIIHHQNNPAGYSKIIFNSPHMNIETTEITKMERFYLLKEFYGLQLGFELFQFNVDLSKRNGQKGMWLFVWKENKRAVNFYQKMGFKVIGEHDFRISPNHTNPNHQMLLLY